MRISDWSSDVCSSDLIGADDLAAEDDTRISHRHRTRSSLSRVGRAAPGRAQRLSDRRHHARSRVARRDRKSVVEGKSVSVRVDLGGRRFIKTKNKTISRNKTNENITLSNQNYKRNR